MFLTANYLLTHKDKNPTSMMKLLLYFDHIQDAGDELCTLIFLWHAHQLFKCCQQKKIKTEIEKDLHKFTEDPHSSHPLKKKTTS